MLRLLLKQISILMWKYWIVRIKHWSTTVFELVGPLFLAVLLAYLYSRSDYNKDDQKWKGPVFNKDPTMTMDLNNQTLNFTQYLHYAPNNSQTFDIMQRILDFHPGDMEAFLTDTMASLQRGGIFIQSHDNETALRRYLRELITDNITYTPFVSGIVFDKSIQSNSSLPIHLKYSILTNGFRPTHVNKYFGRKLTAGPDFGVAAYPLMFCKIQSLVNEAYLTKLTEQYNRTRIKTAAINAYKYPYPKYRDNGDQFFQISIQELIGGSIVLGYIISCPLIVKRITDEKAIKAKELLRMIGMSDWVFWVSHFISFFTIMFVHNIFFSLLFYVGFGGEPIYQYMDPSLFFVILTIYDIQNITFCMLITTVFNQPIIAVVVTVVLYLTTFSIPLGLTHPALHINMDIGDTNIWRLMSCIFPNLGIVWSLAIAGQYEIHSLKIGWTQIFDERGVYEDLSVGITLLAMLSSSIIYAFLIWYVDAVWPFQYGVPKKIYFPFQPSYYCPKEKVSKSESEPIKDGVNFEDEPKSSKAVIKIKNLMKMFGSCGNTRTVVDNISLNIFKGQIFALLGHNGAGKSTTMNMMTGIYPPTEGSIMINGYSVITNTNKARKSIGLCPQENIIYEELTVRQHLKFYAVLKDFPMKKIEAEVQNVIEELRLTNKTNELAIELSGGMKRRLQLGIAIIGGTRILILDEPTSGLDPEARRCIWDVLQNLRQSKTIVLTTHYMEEADAIADRIAILSSGRVKCCGSPMFLKKRFGGGYHLRIAKAKHFDIDIVKTLLRQYLPESDIAMDIGTEVVFSLQRKPDINKPKSETSDNQLKVLPQLFTRLESQKKELKINSFGVSLSSLEEVFINVLSEEENKEKETTIQIKVHTNLRVIGWELFRKQVYGLIMKRVHFAKRFWPIIIFQIALPALLFMTILLVDYEMRNIFVNFAKNLTLDLKTLYGNTNGFFQVKNDRWMSFGIDYYSNVAKTHGMNTTILGPNQDPNNWAISHSSSVETYVRRYILGSAFDSNDDKEMLIDSWYSNEAIHSLPMSLNIIYESLIKYFIPELKNKNVKITVNNKPIGMSEDMLTFGSIIFSYAITCLLLTPITVPFLGASFVLFPIQERMTKSKLLQLMTGVSPLTFWLCNYFFDLVTHVFAVIIIFIVFSLFDYNNTYFGQTNTAIGLFLMLFLFGVASIPAAYCLSFLFKKSSTGYAILVMIYLFFGLIFNLIMSFFDIYINVRDEEIIPKGVYQILLAIFRIFPVFSMCFGIQKLYRTGAFAEQCRQWSKRQEWDIICKSTQNKTDFFYGCCKEKCEANDECYESQSPFKFNSSGIGAEFIYLLVDGLAFILVLYLIEINFFKIFKRRSGGYKKEKSVRDSDVTEEEQRIQELKSKKAFSSDALVVYKLTKHFKNMTAVDGLTFGVHKEECFGLLGVNGAGKTTTFSMLTGDLEPDDGNAFIGKYELMNDMREFSKEIGFCPQFDPLLDKLTAKEMLYLFARLRGVRSSLIEQEVNNLIEMVDLGKYANKITENYSGGNKRKLSLAMAIIGNPPVIFMDEPTAGVDPFARRKIWSTLDIVSKTYKSAFILTSHSMEESEALCGRIAIMVGGRLTCLGSTQHLRTKFGQGFTLDIKLKQELLKDSHYKKNIQKYIQKKFSSAQLKDSHQLILHYHITDASTEWSYIFDVMETAKRKLNLEDYNVSDTSLEQIFLSFALTQYK